MAHTPGLPARRALERMFRSRLILQLFLIHRFHRIAGRGEGLDDSVPLGLTVANEEVKQDTSLLEMFAVLDEEEREIFIKMLDEDAELLTDIAQETK